MKRFIDLAEHAPEEIAELLALAGRLDRHPEPNALTGKVLGMLFFNPSLRTVASFQAAMARLGGGSFVITPGTGTWKLESRHGIVMDGDAAEHVREAVPVLASYADVLGIRAFAGGIDLEADLEERRFMEMAGLCPVPLVNLESAMNHPCQALADWKTMDDLQVPANGGRFVLSWANHPNPLPLAVPAAVVHMAAMRGRDVTVLRPEGYELPEPLMARARAAAAASGGGRGESPAPGRAPPGGPLSNAKCGGAPPHEGRPAARCARPTTGPRPPRARTSSTPRAGPRPATTAARPTTAACGANWNTGWCASPGSATPPPSRCSCTACRYAATWWSPTRSSTARAAACCRRPAIA